MNSIKSAIYAGSFDGYNGIVFDIEEGDAGLLNAFNSCFSAAKSHSLKVLVTVSHSAPYGISDAAFLMRAFFTNSQIDYISPQLYASGYESGNDYSTVAGVNWNEYANSKAPVIPSIVISNYYNDAENYFRGQGVETLGYVQWKN